MRTIDLVTREKDGVHFVACVEIPPFPREGLPEVVVWGTRTFIGPVFQGDRTIYAECIAVMSMTPSPGLDRETDTMGRVKAPELVTDGDRVGVKLYLCKTCAAKLRELAKRNGGIVRSIAWSMLCESCRNPS